MQSLWKKLFPGSIIGKMSFRLFFLKKINVYWMNASLGSSGTFWIYALICAVSYVFLYCRLPETKGKSLEKLERELI